MFLSVKNSIVVFNGIGKFIKFHWNLWAIFQRTKLIIQLIKGICKMQKWIPIRLKF